MSWACVEVRLCFARFNEGGQSNQRSQDLSYASCCTETQREIVLGPQNLQAKAEVDVASYGSKAGFIGITHTSGYVLNPAVLLPLAILSFFPFAQYIPHSV